MPDTALLVIDVQQGLFEEDPPTINADSLTATINELAGRARAAGVPVIFVQHNDPWMEIRTPGWQLHSALDAREGEPRVDKQHPDSFYKTKLIDHLSGIKRLVVCGCQTDMCVDYTSRRAVALGYDVELVADAHSTCNNPILDAQTTIAFYNQMLDGFGARDGFGNGEHQIKVKPSAEIVF
ncbi:MAG TPA: cysteine hydrolase family protein [Fimbriimonadaceae bacterium]|nr:cysteine hydrolase family protein [Fimbriimonadaceae bacterium]